MSICLSMTLHSKYSTIWIRHPYQQMPADRTRHGEFILFLFESKKERYYDWIV